MSSQHNKGPILGLIFLALCAGSCAPTRIVTESQKDSVIVHIRDSVIIRDTIIQAAIPSEADKAIISDTDTSRLQTSLAESVAFVKNGQLHHTLRNRSERVQPVRVQYKDYARATTTEKLRQRSSVEFIEVEKELNAWQRFIMKVGWVALIAAAVWIFLKIKQFFV